MKQLFILLLLTGFINCKSKEQLEPTISTISFILGDVQILHANSKRVAKKGDSIEEGDAIITGAKSSAVLEFANQTGSVEIQQNSEFIINKFNTTEQTLTSKSGSFWMDAKKITKNTNFKVIMPTSVAGIRGTKLYSFEIKEAGITGVCHCQGAVDFKSETTNYSGSHDTDQLVLTKGTKTILLTPEDFKKAGIVSDENHNHSSMENSPLGKKTDMTDENSKKLYQLVQKKFAEK